MSFSVKLEEDRDACRLVVETHPHRPSPPLHLALAALTILMRDYGAAVMDVDVRSASEGTFTVLIPELGRGA